MTHDYLSLITSKNLIGRIGHRQAAWVLVLPAWERHVADGPKGVPVTASSPGVRRIALVAHDNRKQDMLEWAAYNRATLAGHELVATATTGRLLADELGLPVECLLSGPLGGDQQIGARIAEGRIDLMVFLWDPLAPHPHDPDVKALLRVAVVWNVPVACNRASADFLVSSPLLAPSEPAAAA